MYNKYYKYISYKMKNRLLEIQRIAEETTNKMDVKDIIREGKLFQKSYGNPTIGIPKTKDFNWYVLGRVDQLHEKQDEHFNLILEKFDTFNKDLGDELKKKIGKGTFWKLNSMLMFLIIALMGIVFAVPR